MIEVIDNANNKFSARIMCGVKYKDSLYCIYLIDRDDNTINMFISCVVVNSEGISTIDSNFNSVLKNELDNMCNKFINKISTDNLLNDGIEIIRDFKLGNGVNKFDVTNSYVGSINKDDINNIYMYYNLTKESSKNIVKIKENSKKIDSEYKKNIEAIIFGIISMIIIIILIFFLFKK